MKISNSTVSATWLQLKIKEISKRDRQLGRLRESTPTKFEDDEEIYGQMGEDYGNYEKQLGGYRGVKKHFLTCLPTLAVQSFLPR